MANIVKHDVELEKGEYTEKVSEAGYVAYCRPKPAYLTITRSTNGAVEDPVEAKRVMRKVDYRLMPLLMMLYTVTFLDRVNIGNARLWNLERDLHMEGYTYNITVLVFYIPLILFEIPSNVLLSGFVPRYYISALTMSWGCKSYQSSIQ